MRYLFIILLLISCSSMHETCYPDQCFTKCNSKLGEQWNGCMAKCKWFLIDHSHNDNERRLK